MTSTKAIDKKSLLLSVTKLLGLLVIATLVIEVANLDRVMADSLYRWGGNNWYLKDGWLTAECIHKGGKYFSITLVLLTVLMLFASYVLPAFRHWNIYLRFLLVASLAGCGLVSIGKSLSNISCPWDFSRYGGTLEYLSLAEQLFVRNGSHCFPAGHASAGFAWVSLYFVGLHMKASVRWWGLGFALAMGCVFGISQELRGAHFLSHDLWSFGICWMASSICYELMLKPHESVL